MVFVSQYPLLSPLALRKRSNGAWWTSSRAHDQRRPYTSLRRKQVLDFKSCQSVSWVRIFSRRWINTSWWTVSMVHGSYICGHFRSRTAFLILTVKSMSLLVQIAKNYCKHPKLNTQWRESKNKEQWTTLTLLFEVDLSNGQVPGHACFSLALNSSHLKKLLSEMTRVLLYHQIARRHFLGILVLDVLRAE